MLLCVYISRLMSFVICAVAANRSLAGTDKQKVVHGKLKGAVTLRCILPAGTSFSFIEWRFGQSNDLVYFDSTKFPQNRGPKGKFKDRNITGIFLNNETVHDLSIKRTVSTDEGWYICRMRDSQKELHTKIMKLLLVSLPLHPPAIVYRNGTTVSTSDCHNTTTIPSVVVAQKTLFLCKVGKSKPASTVYWKRTFAAKEASSSKDGTERGIEVVPLLNLHIECTVTIPSVDSANFTVRHICLRLTSEQKAQVTEAILSHTNNGHIVNWPLVAVSLVAGLIILILLIIICYTNKICEGCDRNSTSVDSNKPGERQQNTSNLQHGETEVDSKKPGEAAQSTSSFHHAESEEETDAGMSLLPKGHLQADKKVDSNEPGKRQQNTSNLHHGESEVDSNKPGEADQSTSSFHHGESEEETDAGTSLLPEGHLQADKKEETDAGTSLLPEGHLQADKKVDLNKPGKRQQNTSNLHHGETEVDSKKPGEAEQSASSFHHGESEEETDARTSLLPEGHLQADKKEETDGGTTLLCHTDWPADKKDEKDVGAQLLPDADLPADKKDEKDAGARLLSSADLPTDKKSSRLFNAQLAQTCLQWIKETVNKNSEPKVEFSTDGDEENFYNVLKSGWQLVRLIKVLSPEFRSRFLAKEETQQFRQMDAIAEFLTEVKKYKIRDYEMFVTADLWKKNDLCQVLVCLQALGRKLGKFGPKEATENKRAFSPQQLKQGQSILPLQMGSNRGATQTGQNFGKQRSIVD